jgi:hypothetical protein
LLVPSGHWSFPEDIQASLDNGPGKEEEIRKPVGAYGEQSIRGIFQTGR